jgi:hypothetical protein
VKRLAIGLCAFTLSIGFAATGAGAHTAKPEPRDRAHAVAVVSMGLTEYPRADFESEPQVRCVAKGIVNRFGIDRLQELGLDLDAQQGPRLYVPGLTERERGRVAAAYDACLDPEGGFIDGLVAEGLSAAEARCVSESYQASGIPTIHLTEAPHGVSLVDTEPARGHLDDFLNAAKLACREWL